MCPQPGCFSALRPGCFSALRPANVLVSPKPITALAKRPCGFSSPAFLSPAGFPLHQLEAPLDENSISSAEPLIHLSSGHSLLTGGFIGSNWGWWPLKSRGQKRQHRPQAQPPALPPGQLVEAPPGSHPEALVLSLREGNAHGSIASSSRELQACKGACSPPRARKSKGEPATPHELGMTSSFALKLSFHTSKQQHGDTHVSTLPARLSKGKATSPAMAGSVWKWSLMLGQGQLASGANTPHRKTRRNRVRCFNSSTI